MAAWERTFAVQNLYKHYGDAGGERCVFAIAPGNHLIVIRGRNHHHPHVPGPDGPSGNGAVHRGAQPRGTCTCARCAGHQRRSWAWSPVRHAGPGLHLRRNLRVFGRYFGLKAAPWTSACPSCWSLPRSPKGRRQTGRTLGRDEAAPVTGRALVNRPRLLLDDDPPPASTRRPATRLHCCCSKVHPADHPLHGRGRAPVFAPAGAGPRQKIAEGRPRELIAQHLEPDVVEVFGVGAVALAEDAACVPWPAWRSAARPVFFYTQNAQPCCRRWANGGHLRTLHRPANLEDLFLKLTGGRFGSEAPAWRRRSAHPQIIEK